MRFRVTRATAEDQVVKNWGRCSLPCSLAAGANDQTEWISGPLLEGSIVRSLDPHAVVTAQKTHHVLCAIPAFTLHFLQAGAQMLQHDITNARQKIPHTSSESKVGTPKVDDQLVDMSISISISSRNISIFSGTTPGKLIQKISCVYSYHLFFSQATVSRVMPKR